MSATKKKPNTRLNIRDMHKLAKSKGGKCLSSEYVNIMTELKWKCHKGHVWGTAPNNIRNSGSWCPYCSNKLVCEDNCLATVRPDFAKQWHPTLNGDITPRDVVFGAALIVHWQCDVNPDHIWKAKLSDRLYNNRGCPDCSKSLKTSFPEQAIYFYLKKVFPTAENRFNHSLLPKNQEFDIYIPEIDFAFEYDGFPYHNDDKVVSRDIEKNRICKENNINLIHIRCENLPEIDMHGFSKFEHFYSSRREYSSLDNCIKSIFNYILNDKKLDSNLINKIKMVIENIDSLNDTADIESLIKRKRMENSILKTHPEIAKFWHPKKNKGMLPEHYTYGSNKIVNWMCPDNSVHIITKSIKKVVRNGLYCLRCNSIGEKYPDLCKTLHPTKNGNIDIYNITCGSEKKLFWICEKNPEHVFSQLVYYHVKNQNCLYCRDKTVTKENSFSSVYPELSKTFHPTLNGDKTTNDFSFASTSREYYWHCEKNKKHVFLSTPNDRRKINCPFCSGRKVLNEDSFAANFPDLHKEWLYEKNDRDPFTLSPNSHYKAYWVCRKNKNHVWTTRISTRTKRRIGNCPYCSGKKSLNEKNKKQL